MLDEDRDILSFYSHFFTWDEGLNHEYVGI